MPDYQEKIRELEDKIANTPYNKKTQHAIGLYKAQIAKLKERQMARGSSKGSSEGYHVRKTGNGTVILVGFPSVGKSTLLNGLTNADSEVGSYAFTTLTVVPGVLEHNHAKIQVLDVPGIVSGAASGKGRGKEVLSTMRSADLILILVDALHPEHLSALKTEIWETGIRLDQRKPDVKITKKTKGGISVGSTVPLKKIDKATIKAILHEFRVSNADVVIRSDLDADSFIDCIEGNKKYVPSLLVVNKVDLVDAQERKRLKRLLKPDMMISAENMDHIENLKDIIFEKMDFIRIYMKEPGKEADMDEPLIAFKESTVGDVCEKLHKDFVKNFKFCRIWGPSSKFDGQKLMQNHVLKDGDVVELHMR
ncbi:MAG: OBG GTPase family GTP-binding protein [Candidatus Woesearchaeota archaeon]